MVDMTEEELAAIERRVAVKALQRIERGSALAGYALAMAMLEAAAKPEQIVAIIAAARANLGKTLEHYEDADAVLRLDQATWEAKISPSQ